MEQLTKLKKLIAAGTPRKAFDELIYYMDEQGFEKQKVKQKYYNQVMLLSGRLKTITTESRLGILSAENERVGRTRISYDLMNLLDEFPNSMNSDTIKETYIAESSVTKRTIDDEERLWGNVKKKDNIFFYETYIELYPEGKYITKAKVRKSKLSEIEKEQKKVSAAIKENQIKVNKEKEVEKTNTKIGGLAVFLALIAGGGTFFATQDIATTFFALVGVYVLMVIITFLFEKS